jgi:hypothetical protein
MKKLREIKKAVASAVATTLGTVVTAITTQDWKPVLIAAITGVIATLSVYQAENE